ncbi:hypothetical protein [Niastella sp. OAS944]|uniref:hypothetical protein n=1 Tax=Niastella sp. OAS944 TaxID=2664089 RepID=UPI0034854CFB|nr:hypothetical protein [Chitinophagaceae bacterium OAS944]
MNNSTLWFKRLISTQNKRYFYIAGAAIIVQFILFKLCYPFADYFNDSFTYINAAAKHHSMSVRPIGYSRFLQLVHLVTSSDTVVVFLQYFTIQAGALMLFFTLRYFFPLPKKAGNWLFGILLFNPLYLYIGNYISSDALFAGVGLMWTVTLIWVINKPRWLQLLPLAGLLFIMFSLRYAALYLPAVALLTLLLSRRSWLFKLTGITVTVLPLFIEYQRIKSVTKKETGTAVFSAFSGWVAANNALHMYPYIHVRNEDFLSPECKALNHLVKQYFDTVPASALPYPYARVNYMWGDISPLKAYMRAVEEKKKIKSYFDAWHAVAPVFLQYGNQLILQHPIAYARYFMWPNTKEYCVPPLESLLSYNEMRTTVDSTAIKWFRYKSEKMSSINPTIQGKILSPVPWLFFLVNIFFCGSLAFILIRRRQYALSPDLLRTLLLAGVFFIITFCFSTYAAPITLRYQLLPMVIYSAFLIVMINVIISRRYQPSVQ